MNKIDHLLVLMMENRSFDHYLGAFGQEFGPRWQKAPDIWTPCFDFAQTPLPMGAYTGDPPQIQTLHWGSGIHDQFKRLPDTYQTVLERIFVIPELKALDRRAAVFDGLTELEQHVITLKRMF